jgi:hypothetical protein
MSVSSPWELCLRAVQAEGMQAWRAGCGVIVYRNSSNRAVRMALSLSEMVQPSPRHAESSQGAPRRIPASLKVWLFSPAAGQLFVPQTLTKLMSYLIQDFSTRQKISEHGGLEVQVVFSR